jgi:hypothetical protein
LRRLARRNLFVRRLVRRNFFVAGWRGVIFLWSGYYVPAASMVESRVGCPYFRIIPILFVPVTVLPESCRAIPDM